MTRTPLIAALVAVLAATAGAAATPYPGTTSRIQDNAHVMSRDASRMQDGTFTSGVRSFGAPQEARGMMTDGSDRSYGYDTSVRRHFGTSSDRFQDNADANR